MAAQDKALVAKTTEAFEAWKERQISALGGAPFDESTAATPFALEELLQLARDRINAAYDEYIAVLSKDKDTAAYASQGNCLGQDRHWNRYYLCDYLPGVIVERYDGDRLLNLPTLHQLELRSARIAAAQRKSASAAASGATLQRQGASHADEDDEETQEEKMAVEEEEVMEDGEARNEEPDAAMVLEELASNGTETTNGLHAQQPMEEDIEEMVELLPPPPAPPQLGGAPGEDLGEQAAGMGLLEEEASADLLAWRNNFEEPAPLNYDGNFIVPIAVSCAGCFRPVAVVDVVCTVAGMG